jgi:hypothetical protein
MRELLEVDHQVVTPAPDRAKGLPQAADQAAIALGAHPDGVVHDPRALEQRAVLPKGEKVDLDARKPLSQGRHRGEQHGDVAEAVELDGEEPLRTGYFVLAGRRGAAQFRLVRAPEPASDSGEQEQQRAGHEPHPAVDVPGEGHVHGTRHRGLPRSCAHGGPKRPALRPPPGELLLAENTQFTTPPRGRSCAARMKSRA